MSNKDLLKYFYENFKIYDDEKFKFLKYPDVNKYKYVISNYGRVFTFVGMKEKKTYSDKDGYLRSSISFLNKKSTSVGIHRLVAFTFIKNKDKKRNLVNHKDGIKQNNYYKNLEWVTPKENTNHAILNGLQINSGPDAPSAIYPEEVIHKICKLLEDGNDVSQIYKVFLPDHKKITDRAFYALIFSIKSKKRHTSISKKYNLPDVVKSNQKPKFTQEEVDKITEMINNGNSTKEIIHFFGGTTSKTYPGKRIFDKIQTIKKTLNNPK